MTRYAANTTVSEERTRAEIEGLLLKYGADEFGYMTRRTEAVIVFLFRGIHVQMSVPLPDRADERFHQSPKGRRVRSEKKAFDEWQQEVRRRWRSLSAVIKALLIGVEDGVISFEQAFMPYIVMGDGRTVSQHALPRILQAIDAGTMPNTLKQLEMLP